MGGDDPALAKPLDSLRRRSSFGFRCFPQSHNALVLSCGRPIHGWRKYLRHDAETVQLGPVIRGITSVSSSELTNLCLSCLFKILFPKNASHPILSAINDFLARPPILHGLERSSPASPP